MRNMNYLPFRGTLVHLRILVWFVFVARSLVFYVMFCRSLFVLLAIVLSSIDPSDYPLSIFKLFLIFMSHDCLEHNTAVTVD